jgi:hypothetical protein
MNIRGTKVIFEKKITFVPPYVFSARLGFTSAPQNDTGPLKSVENDEKPPKNGTEKQIGSIFGVVFHRFRAIFN